MRIENGFPHLPHVGELKFWSHLKMPQHRGEFLAGDISEEAETRLRERALQKTFTSCFAASVNSTRTAYDLADGEEPGKGLLTADRKADWCSNLNYKTGASALGTSPRSSFTR